MTMFKINRFCLGLFLAVVWPSIFVLCAEEPLPDAAPAPQATTAAAPGATPVANSSVPAAQEEVRDPFAQDQAPGGTAPVASQPSAPTIKVELQGIGFGSKDAYAIIGGEIFYKGDEKQGIKLLEVRRREVDILVSGGKVTVPLFEDQDLKRAKDRAKKIKATENVSADQPAKTPSSLSEREQPPL